MILLPHNNVRVDISNQAHVYVNPTILNPPPDIDFDTRDIDTIVREGLNPAYTAIDDIIPPSVVILHEVSEGPALLFVVLTAIN